MDISSLDFEKMDMGKIQDILQKVNFSAGKKVEETLKVIMEAVIKKGVVPKQALKLSDDTMEAIYTQGYNLYNQGRYKEASYIFRLLTLLDFITPKYFLGLAASVHRLKDYQNAANLYLMCAGLDPTNPYPHFYSADCYLQLNAVEIAVLCLTMAISVAGEQPQYSILKERAILLRKGLEKKALERAEGKIEDVTPGTVDFPKEPEREAGMSHQGDITLD